MEHILKLSWFHNSCQQNFCVTKCPKTVLFFQFHIPGTVYVNYLLSGLKTYFICGRVAPDINPIKTRPEGPVAVMKTSTFVLQTDMINESNYQVDEKKAPKSGIFRNCCPIL